MLMKTKERWHCSNPACACEVIVETNGEVEGNNPRCACGAAMKKKYASPALSYLEFMRLEERPKAGSRKE